MKTFLRYEDLPTNNFYLGSENTDGSIYEEVQNLIDDAIEPVALFDKNGNFKKNSKGEEIGHFKTWSTKIILTTDQDLIKDGVQAIDDEFLEWFVENPSCEKDEVNKGFADGTAYGYNFLDYKIIIPKEEAKQSVQEYEQQGLEKYFDEPK